MEGSKVLIEIVSFLTSQLGVDVGFKDEVVKCCQKSPVWMGISLGNTPWISTSTSFNKNPIFLIVGEYISHKRGETVTPQTFLPPNIPNKLAMWWNRSHLFPRPHDFGYPTSFEAELQQAALNLGRAFSVWHPQLGGGDRNRGSKNGPTFQPKKCFFGKKWCCGINYVWL